MSSNSKANYSISIDGIQFEVNVFNSKSNKKNLLQLAKALFSRELNKKMLPK